MNKYLSIGRIHSSCLVFFVFKAALMILKIGCTLENKLPSHSHHKSTQITARYLGRRPVTAQDPSSISDSVHLCYIKMHDAHASCIICNFIVANNPNVVDFTPFRPPRPPQPPPRSRPRLA
ncbi:hypothetical protein EVAR_100248_1 [Eumeta japonica]|uniref:Uncharacterized protein n=1 Tax=Eumeta variegata TaxID=151549 RepID=A0A4C2AF34_EUMVA|nr:hypothetical protein EVAR_100248_1 [Eumeta japonica]